MLFPGPFVVDFLIASVANVLLALLAEERCCDGLALVAHKDTAVGKMLIRPLASLAKWKSGTRLTDAIGSICLTLVAGKRHL